MNSFRAYQDCCRLAAALFVLWCGVPELHWHLPLRRMKKAPDQSWGPALQPGRCRGTYPPPAAGCSLACMAAKEKAAGRDCLPRLRLSQVHYTMPGM